MANSGSAYKCLRCAVFSFNILCFICALLLISVGAYVQVLFSDYGSQLQVIWQAAPIAIIVLGVVILLISFLGCCGAIKENACMLITYGVLLVVFLIAEIAIASIAIYNKDKIDPEIAKNLAQAVKDYEKPAIREIIDKIQSTFKCCGGAGRDDYPVDKIPESCADYNEGCAAKFATFLKEKLVIVACVALGICFLQLLSLIVAFYFGKQVRSYNQV